LRCTKPLRRRLSTPTARRKLDHGDEVVESRLHEEDEAKRALTELYDLGAEHPAPEQGPSSCRARAPRAASPPKRPNPGAPPTSAPEAIGFMLERMCDQRGEPLIS
jgi:hypothetical protein